MSASKGIFSVTKHLNEHICLKNIKVWYISKSVLSFPHETHCEEQLHIMVTLEDILPEQGVMVYTYSPRT